MKNFQKSLIEIYVKHAFSKSLQRKRSSQEYIAWCNRSQEWAEIANIEGNRDLFLGREFRFSSNRMEENIFRFTEVLHRWDDVTSFKQRTTESTHVVLKNWIIASEGADHMNNRLSRTYILKRDPPIGT
jgi:hypothetical protein